MGMFERLQCWGAGVIRYVLNNGHVFSLSFLGMFSDDCFAFIKERIDQSTTMHDILRACTMNELFAYNLCNCFSNGNRHAHACMKQKIQSAKFKLLIMHWHECN